MITNSDLEQAARFINFLNVISDSKNFAKLVKHYQDAVAELNDQLGIYNSKQAFDAFVLKEKQVLADERAQLEKDKQEHAEWVNAAKAENQRLLDLASAEMAEARKKVVEAQVAMLAVEKASQDVGTKIQECKAEDVRLSVREAALDERERALNEKADKLKEMFK